MAFVVVLLALALTVAVLIQSRTESPVRLTEEDDPKTYGAGLASSEKGSG